VPERVSWDRFSEYLFLNIEVLLSCIFSVGEPVRHPVVLKEILHNNIPLE